MTYEGRVHHFLTITLPKLLEASKQTIRVPEDRSSVFTLTDYRNPESLWFVMPMKINFHVRDMIARQTNKTPTNLAILLYLAGDEDVNWSLINRCVHVSRI